MLFEFNSVLTPDQVRDTLDALEGQEFVDGRETALNDAQLVKRNVQLGANSELRTRLGAVIESALWANPRFTNLVLPKRIGPFHFSRYEVGMEYGDHVDNSVMGLNTSSPMRADMSMTIFLNNPTDYDGGELVLNSRISPRTVKLSAGDAIVYPTAEFHRVAPVTRGTRRAAVTWIECLVRSTARRQVLTDMYTALDTISRLQPPEMLHENEAFRTLAKTNWSLLRLWAET